MALLSRPLETLWRNALHAPYARRSKAGFFTFSHLSDRPER